MHAGDATPYPSLPRAAAQAYSPRPLTAGERWTAEALSELRRGRYRPAAWSRFIGRSLERSTEARRDHPRIARQSRRWGATGAVAWLAACEVSRRHPTASLERTSGLLWWLAVWQMLDWHLGMAEGGDGKPRERLSPADALTLTRFWLVPLAPGLRRSRHGLPAVILVGGLTDWLDGALARHDGRTRLGRDLDTTADLAFLGAAGASAHAAGRLPKLGAWALGARYSLGVTVALAATFARARRPPIRARPWGAGLRVAGLAIATSGGARTGTVVLAIGCLVPPLSTAPQLSRA